MTCTCARGQRSTACLTRWQLRQPDEDAHVVEYLDQPLCDDPALLEHAPAEPRRVKHRRELTPMATLAMLLADLAQRG